MNLTRTGRGFVPALVLVLMAATFSSYVQFEGDGGPPVDATDAKELDNYSSVSTGLPTSGDYFYVVFGDVNGDGYDDIATGAGQYPSSQKDTNGLYVYTSKAGDGWEKNSTGLPTTGNYAGIDLGDLDGDGDLDLVAGGEQWSGSAVRGCRVYLNNGTSGGKLSWITGTNPDTSMYYDQCVIADVNDDGDMDIVAGTRSNGIKCWLGDGGAGGSLTWTSKVTGLPSSGEYTGVEVADFNKDGDMDIIATDYSTNGPEVRLYTGDGTGNWTSRASSFANDRVQTFGVQAGDVDDDGDMDIVYCGKRGIVCLLGNSGGTDQASFTWTKSNTNLPSSGTYMQVTLADLDTDGDLDIAAGKDGGGIEVYLGNGGAGGSQSWTKVSKNLPTSGKYYGCAVGDFNDDSVPDIAGALWGTSTTGGLRAFEGSVTNTGIPVASAVFYGTTDLEASILLGESTQLDGRDSTDDEDAPGGDPTGLKLTYEWNISKKPAASARTDSDLSPSDSNATPSFTPDAVGNYTFTLAVQDSDGNWSEKEASLELEVMKPNEPPVADAGPDQDVYMGDLVLLNSSASHDPDGTILAWQWRVEAGNPAAVNLINATLPESSFIAPDVEGKYVFNLTVRDDNDTWSAPSVVNVTVSMRPNVPPVAVAPVDFAARTGELVRLNASGSYDTDGTVVGWDWKCTSHPSMPLTGNDTEEVSFTPVLPGDYDFTIRVLDDRGDWSVVDFVTVEVLPAAVNVPPVAEISGAAVQFAYVGDIIKLNASASRDDDGAIVEYVWNCTSHPALPFSGQNSTEITFQPVDTGDYVFTLAVKDDNETWSRNEDTVTVNITRAAVNKLPVPVITGLPDVQRPGSTVYLDGSGSYDPDGPGVVNYTWECISHPSLSFTGQYTYAVSFVVNEVGDYTFTLKVQDDVGDWSVELDHFTTRCRTNVLPEANITGPASARPGENVSLNGSASSDEDGSVVGYKWNITSHPSIEMNGSEEAVMSFTVMEAGTYQVRLVVQDNEGAWSAYTEHTIIVTPIDQPPVANAGPDRTISESGSVTLDGSDSYDPEGRSIAEWEWSCTSHPSVSGFTRTDEARAEFDPPGPGTFRFQLRVRDEADQWSSPDETVVTVTEDNRPPEVTIVKPVGGTVSLDGHELYIEWTVTDPNGDTVDAQVTLYREGGLDDQGIFVGTRRVPRGQNNITFNDTSYNIPKRTNLFFIVEVQEVGGDALTVEERSEYFQIIEQYIPDGPDGGDEGEDEGSIIPWLVLVLLVVIVVVAILVGSRGSSSKDEEEELPWEDETGPAKKTAAKPAAKSAAKASKPAAAGAVATRKASALAERPEREETTAKDPKGRVLDCPDCGAPLDYDTDFGAPYCWDCDKYF